MENQIKLNELKAQSAVASAPTEYNLSSYL